MRALNQHLSLGLAYGDGNAHPERAFGGIAYSEKDENLNQIFPAIADTVSFLPVNLTAIAGSFPSRRMVLNPSLPLVSSYTLISPF